MSRPDINAGQWYLRGRDGHSWDVCEPTTGVAFAEVEADPHTGNITVRGSAAAGRAGAAAVSRYLAIHLPDSEESNL